MIKTIIFDFGDVFINLDKPAIERELKNLGVPFINAEMYEMAGKYEKGLVTTQQLLQSFTDMFPSISKIEFSKAWNSIILDFPEYRLKFIEQLAKEKKYTLILLSNTNELHIQQAVNNMTLSNYNRFKSCFNKFYLSHEINLSKPSLDIFEFVITKNKLNPKECLFIDDTKENTNTAALLDIKVWNNNPETEDITDLFSINKNLF